MTPTIMNNAASIRLLSEYHTKYNQKDAKGLMSGYVKQNFSEDEFKMFNKVHLDDVNITYSFLCDLSVTEGYDLGEFRERIDNHILSEIKNSSIRKVEAKKALKNRVKYDRLDISELIELIDDMFLSKSVKEVNKTLKSALNFLESKIRSLSNAEKKRHLDYLCHEYYSLLEYSKNPEDPYLQESYGFMTKSVFNNIISGLEKIRTRLIEPVKRKKKKTKRKTKRLKFYKK